MRLKPKPLCKFRLLKLTNQFSQSLLSNPLETFLNDRSILSPIYDNIKTVKLEKIQQSTLTKTIFATLAINALVGTMLIFPSSGYIIKYFSADKNRHKYVRKIFRKLEKQKLISISEKPNGEVTIGLTESGK